MDPWLLALLAGAIGVATLASSAANQAAASMPRVTGFALVDLPTPGLNGQWDLWVTQINGLSGLPMLRLIPGTAQTVTDTNQAYLWMIYIPAAVIAKQPTNVDFKYTFTPKGAAAPWTILVPAAILQAYAALPKTDLVKRMAGSLAFQNQIMQQGALTALLNSSSSSPCDVLQPDNVVSQVKSAIQAFPASGSNAMAYISWTATYGMKVYNDANDVINCINSGQLSDTGGWMSYLSSAAPQLFGLVGQAASSAFSSGGGSDGGGGGGGQDMPSDQGGGGGGGQDMPSDSA